MVQRTKVIVFCVHPHSITHTLEQLCNSVADNQTKISQARLDFPLKEDYKGLLKWTHQKYGYFGEAANYRWAQEHGIIMSLNTIISTVAKCPVHQHTHKCLLSNIEKGQLRRGKLLGWGKVLGQICQMDYIGLLPQEQGCKYVGAAVDTYSGYWTACPFTKATHHSTIYHRDDNPAVWNLFANSSR